MPRINHELCYTYAMGRPPSPFDHIKFRRAVGYLAIGLIPYALITMLDNVILSDIVTLIWIHGTMLWWGREQIVGTGLNINHLFGSFKWSSVVLVIGITVLMIVMSYGVILLYYFGLITLFGNTFLGIINTNAVGSQVGVVLGIVLIPYIEEFFFRGVLMQTLVSRLGFTKGIILSSLVFGFAHFEFISATIFGIVLAILYIKFKSLWVPIAVHTLNNAIAFLPSLLFSSVDDVSSSDLVASETLWIGLFLVGITLPFVVFLLRRWWPQSGELLPLVYNASNG